MENSPQQTNSASDSPLSIYSLPGMDTSFLSDLWFEPDEFLHVTESGSSAYNTDVLLSENDDESDNYETFVGGFDGIAQYSTTNEGDLTNSSTDMVSGLSMFDPPSSMSSSWSYIPYVENQDTKFHHHNVLVHNMVNYGEFTYAPVEDGKISPAGSLMSVATHSYNQTQQIPVTLPALHELGLNFGTPNFRLSNATDQQTNDQSFVYDPLSGHNTSDSLLEFSPPSLYSEYISSITGPADSPSTLPSMPLSAAGSLPSVQGINEKQSPLYIDFDELDVSSPVTPSGENRWVDIPVASTILRSTYSPRSRYSRGPASSSMSKRKKTFVLTNDAPGIRPGLLPRDLADKIILQARAQHYHFNEIQKLMSRRFNIKMAESTMRGRYRTLTVQPRDRARDVKWTARDLNLLNDAVRAQCPNGSRLSSLGTEQELNKVGISWANVADYICPTNMNGPGSRRFDRTACKKKFMELHRINPNNTRPRKPRKDA